MIKVHLIFNAHLDPCWFWGWRDGLDEVLNTSHYLCGLLDRNPDVIYTRGEAWVYEQIRRIDPALFERIRGHVKAGRWSPVGGWYIQPDCNAPSGFAMERQISLGQKLFREYFGEAPRIGYNVDSFGHAATFPGLMKRAGQSSYVMMRPQEHEMALPARLFRWCGYADGPEVTTFRIARAYTTPEGLTREHIEAAATELPAGVGHTMCFVGIGDHGGGPTEAMIAWCRENRTALPRLELVFSSPAKFFEAIAPDLEKLPMVTGELQMHAVGCYTVHRPVKTALRRAEHRMMQAEVTLRKFPAVTVAGAAEQMEIAWKLVCFHQFHDTLGGTCLPSAYADIDAQLGRALAIADEVSAVTLRRLLVSLEENAAQRMVLFNASDLAFDDYIEIEPWLEWSAWQPTWRLVDEHGVEVAHQAIAPEAMGQGQARLHFRMAMGAGEMKVLRIVDGKIPAVAPPGLAATASELRVVDGPSVRLGSDGALEFPGLGELPLPELALYDDATDTWGHGIDRFAALNREAAVWEPAQVVDEGPLMGSLVQKGMVGSSAIQAEWRVHLGRPWVEFLLRVAWAEKHRVLKLQLRLPSDVAEREDGILGGSFVRAMDGRELPVRDWTRVRLNNATDFAVVMPEVYALDGDAGRIGLTLLRSPLMAWHEPNPGTHPRGIFSDRGEHFFRFRFLAGGTLSAAELDRMAFGMQRPPLTADVTRGMKNRALRREYAPGAGADRA